MINDKNYKNRESNSIGSNLLFDNKIWLTSKDAAAYLSRSVGQIRNMVYRGQLKAYKFHGRLLFKRRELYDLIESTCY